MPTIELETVINAPPEACFDLVRDIRIHTQTTFQANGEIGLGRIVTFESRQFGVRQRLTVKVIEFDPPQRLVDAMIDGRFRSFVHVHEFEAVADGTVMRDTLIWESPFGFLGRLVDAVMLKRHLIRLVTQRNSTLKAIAEADHGS